MNLQKPIVYPHSAAQSLLALGIFRVITLNKIWELAHCHQSEQDDVSNDMHRFIEGIDTVMMSLGLDTLKKEIIPGGLKHLDEPVDFLVNNSLFEDKLCDVLKDQFGAFASLVFAYAQGVCLIQCLAGVFRYAGPSKLPAKRRVLVQAQRKKAREAILVLAEFLQEHASDVADELGHDLVRACKRIVPRRSSSRWTQADFAGMCRRAEPPLNAMVPHFPLIDERHARASELLRDVAGCEPGQSDWNRFESACVRSLRFLFIPPFRKVTVQVRDEVGHERRDAILPNNQFIGFWNLVRHEFDCKHVVCEFKNSRASAKDDLNQLRIYLSKPTIGRFGFLFHRGAPSQSLLQARRNAYEQSQVMILLINEIVLARLFSARVFLGSADAVLEDMKADFEVNY